MEAEDGGIVSHDQARAIDALGKRVAIAAEPGGIRIVQGRVRCTAVRIVNKAVTMHVYVDIISDDQARAIDTLRKGAAGSEGNVEGCVNATAVDETMRVICGINVITDDLAGIVDALS